jgi:membrane associated rhomboid family serine protease
MTPETAPTCYRHPDRTTGLSCTECGRPICAECSIPAAVGQRCPQCVAEAGRQRTITARSIGRPNSRTAPLTFGFIAIAVGIEALSLFAPALWSNLADQLALFNGLAIQGEWYRMFTVTLVHAGLTHILFNMYALYLLGPGIEMRVGRVRYGLLFLAAAGAGSALAILLGSPGDVAVGASGAIFGLFGVWAVSAFNQRNTRLGRAQFNAILLNLAINAAIPLFIPRVSWQAHLGGFVAGLAFGWIFINVRGKGSERIHIAFLLAIILGSVLVI